MKVKTGEGFKAAPQRTEFWGTKQVRLYVSRRVPREIVNPVLAVDMLDQPEITMYSSLFFSYRFIPN